MRLTHIKHALSGFVNLLKTYPFQAGCILILNLVPFGVQAKSLHMDGLQQTAWVDSTENLRLNILAQNDHDLYFLLGYYHAKDRFFEMDIARRRITGELAALLGEAHLEEDFRNRLLTVSRASQRTWHQLDQSTRSILSAYSKGVNAYLAQGVLSEHYENLHLSQAKPWHPLDSIAIMKGITIQLSLRIDTARTEKLQSYIAQGQRKGFDGHALYFHDTHPTRPISSQTTYTSAGLEAPYLRYFEMKSPAPTSKSTPSDPATKASEPRSQPKPEPEPTNTPVHYIADLNTNLKKSQLWRSLLSKADTPHVGSNWWAVTGEKSATGLPILASDPHLSTPWPGVFYPVHLRVTDDPDNGPMNAAGATFAGVPAIAHGQNKSLVWVSTNNPLDASDVFHDTLTSSDQDFASETSASTSADHTLVKMTDNHCRAKSGWCVLSKGTHHPVQFLSQTYHVNYSTTEKKDHVLQIEAPKSHQRIAIVGFRTYGPILKLIKAPNHKETGEALTLQYTALAATRELQALTQWPRLQDIDSFRRSLSDFESGSQNWLVADSEGNLGYFASGRLPLRTDLELGLPVNHGPAFIRPGKGSANWLPAQRPTESAQSYQSLPAAQMPAIINPPSGMIINANNDPTGITLDGHLFNQARLPKEDPGTQAIYYLNHGYADGLRAERIHTRMSTLLEKKKRLNKYDIQRIQLDTAAQDAIYLVPKLQRAYTEHCPPENTQQSSAFTSLCQNPFLAKALDSLKQWDHSMPSGVHWSRATIIEAEKNASQAALYYHLWRAQLVKRMIQAPVKAQELRPPSGRYALRVLIHKFHSQPFSCAGRSGLDFCPQSPTELNDVERGNYALLSALVEVKHLLDSESYQSHLAQLGLTQWVWGAFHRQAMKPLSKTAGLSVPDQTLLNQFNQWKGFPRSGGYEAVNANGINADTLDPVAAISRHGPARRTLAYVHHNWLKSEVLSTSVVPTAHQAQWKAEENIRRWVTNQQENVMQKETFMRLRWQKFKPEVNTQ